MTSVSIIIGVLLILTGIAGYVHGSTTGAASVTALIPAAFGALLALFGLIGAAKEGLRKHLMHAAVAVALLGFIFPTARIVSRISTLEMTPAVISQIVTAVLCLLFVLLGIRSFIAARRERNG